MCFQQILHFRSNKTHTHTHQNPATVTSNCNTNSFRFKKRLGCGFGSSIDLDTILPYGNLHFSVCSNKQKCAQKPLYSIFYYLLVIRRWLYYTQRYRSITHSNNTPPRTYNIIVQWHHMQIGSSEWSTCTPHVQQMLNYMETNVQSRWRISTSLKLKMSV
jgi:hypothetical protein